MIENDETRAAPPTWTEMQLNRLAEQAQCGDHRAMAELRSALDLYPALQAEFTDLATMARQQRAQATFGADNLLAHDLLERRVADMRSELEGQHPSPLERLVVEQVATCWAVAYLADLDVSKAGSALEKADYYDRRHYRAHKRYLDAILALARVRRLLAPAVAQVNIAQSGAQQLNVAAPDQAPGLINPSNHADTPTGDG